MEQLQGANKLLELKSANNDAMYLKRAKDQQAKIDNLILQNAKLNKGTCVCVCVCDTVYTHLPFLYSCTSPQCIALHCHYTSLQHAANRDQSLKLSALTEQLNTLTETLEDTQAAFTESQVCVRVYVCR
jgi:hypothetical protein